MGLDFGSEIAPGVPQVSPRLCSGESLGVCPTLALAQDVGVDGQYGPRVITEVLGDFVDRCSES